MSKKKFLIETPEELQEKVDAYFSYCDGQPTRTKDGRVVVNQYGRIVYDRQPQPPSMAGLCLFCGFRGRNTFTNQKYRSPDFADVVARAQLRLENYCEIRLYDQDGYGGAAFKLIRCYGWDATVKGKDNKDKPIGIKIEVR